jgi:hypothetical protein
MSDDEFSLDNLPEIRQNVIASQEPSGSGYAPPLTIRDAGTARVLDREIDRWSVSLGSYGMGGPGFFGLHLTPAGDYPAEWLLLTLWGAGEWLLLDGVWVEAHPNQYVKQRPLYSNFGGEDTWDQVSGKVIRARITSFEVADRTSRIVLAKGNSEHVLEIPEDTSLLPLYGGNLEPHIWFPGESQLDAWVISETGELQV